MNEIQFLKDAFHCADICNMENKGWKYYNNSKESGKGFFPFAEEKEYDEEPNEMLILWAKKQPTPFKAVYPDGMKELRKEFQDAVGNIFHQTLTGMPISGISIPSFMDEQTCRERRH